MSLKTLDIEPVTRDLWRQQVAGFRDYNYRQIWEFGEACALRLGAASEHVALRNGAGIEGLADVRRKKLPLLNTGIAYVNYGPLVRRDENADPLLRLTKCLHALRREYVDRRGLVLRILPAIGDPAWLDAQARAFDDAGFIKSTGGRTERTLLVDLARPLDEIRKSLDQKWRNGLNGAEKKNLPLRCGSSPELLHDFLKLYDQLRSRKSFTVDLDAEFYDALQPTMADADRFFVSLVDIDHQPVAGHLSSMVGDTCVYILGATNELGMKTKASYLLQWHTIEQARQRGCRWYDLGGIDPDGNPGVYHFKQGLGGIDVTVPGPFEALPNGLNRYLVLAAEKIYRSIKRNQH